MSQDTTTVSTAANWLVILIITVLFLSFMSFVWEIAKSLWANWGNSAFWLSSAIAAIVGVLAWWGVGLVAYLTAPRTVASSTPSMQQSATASGGSTITQNQAGHDIVINSLAPSETVPGTNVTERQLREAFPFGYVIFSQRDGKWTYSPLPSDKMQYTGDWDKVAIGIDFEHGGVRWIVPDFNSTNTNIKLTAGRITADVPLNPKQITIVRAFVFGNQAILCVATLSDNQRFPVFVLGFRIVSEDETKSGKLDAPWTR
jgi:hypothetical protein